MTVIPVGALIRNRKAPELGSGRVLSELEGGVACVIFENSEDVQEVRLAHTDIVRQPLIPGTRVRVQKGSRASEAEITRVNWPKTPRDLCTYVVRQHGLEEEVLESQVSPLAPATPSPVDALGALHWRGPFRFFSRWDMHRMVSGWYEDSEGIPSAIGARIQPALQHVHALRRVLWDGTCRYFLADEDVDSRIYEAGMVYQRMCAADGALRVLVIAPGRRTHRWQTDLEMRFGHRDFVRIDATHLAQNSQDRWAAVGQNQRLIVSMTCFQQYPDILGELILGDIWDLVIVDDAHRLRNEDPITECLKSYSATMPSLLMLGALPERADARAWEPILSILRGDAVDSDRAEAKIEAEIEARSPIWATTLRAREVLRDAQQAGALDDARAEQVADSLDELLGDDGFVRELAEQFRRGDLDALGQCVGYLQHNYRLERRVVRSRRAHLERYDISWGERSVETLEYAAGSSERALVEHLASLPPASPVDPLQMALRRYYYQAASGSPDRFFSLLEARLDALDTTAGQAHQDLAIFDILDMDMGPREERLFREQVIAGACALDDEIVWIVEAMSLVGQWHAESSSACARVQAAADWMQARLSQGSSSEDASGEESVAQELPDAQKSHESPKILVRCSSGEMVRDAGAYFEARFGESVVEMIYCGMASDVQTEAVERFGYDRNCRILVCEETGAQGRNIGAADFIVHLTQPWSAARVERRVAQVDTVGRAPDSPVHSVVLVGPARHEQLLHQFYCEDLGLYTGTAMGYESVLPQLDRRIGRAACDGPEELEEAIKDLNTGVLSSVFSDALDPQTAAYQCIFDPSDRLLEEDAEFCELLEFVDGIADSLPVRHWARMLGIQDQSASPGTFDFKWHWSNVRRALAGYPVGPEDVDILLPEEQVGMHTGTFSRKRALRSEGLEFFGPGHQFVDALVEDAMIGNALPAPGFVAGMDTLESQQPQDGRSTVFARRLGPENRGKTFLNIVFAARLDRSAWDGLDMPQGLINRAYRHLWPEALSVSVEIDIKGERRPKLVQDRALIQKIEASYQGPEADQKIEYEIFIQAIEDVARFRETLDSAVKLAATNLAVEREGLVDGAVAELSDDIAEELAFLRAQAARCPDPEDCEAALQLRRYDCLLESVRLEKLEVDAIAVVVAGSPQVLIR